MKLIIASNNENKIREIKQILSSNFNEILSMREADIDMEIEETGETFYENALLKAKTISLITNEAVLADDSGLCVYALDNEPGVYSARYAGEPSNDDNNNSLLLKNLEPYKDRSAEFVSEIVLYLPDGKIVQGSGIALGTILYDYKGTGGFGYDPLFYSNELGKTFAEATSEEKNSISHRARALRNLLLKL